MAKTLVNLGGAYQMLGQYEKAKDIIERALNIEENALWARPLCGGEDADKPGQRARGTR